MKQKDIGSLQIFSFCVFLDLTQGHYKFWDHTLMVYLNNLSIYKYLYC
jgi:hypothetical protein